MTVLAHLSVVGYPSDGASVGRFVQKAVEVLRASGLKHEVHAMGTEIECGSLAELWPVVETIDAALVKMGAQRVTVMLKIDDRRDKAVGLSEKAAAARGRAQT